MEPADRAKEVSLLPGLAPDPRLHLAMSDRAATVRPAEKITSPEPTAGGASPEPPLDLSLDLPALLGARPANAEPVSIDEARARPVSASTFFEGVIGDCLERAAMLARHRDDRPMNERPRAEARLLAQIDAIAEAGATEADLLRWWEEEGEEDPWMTWAAVFALSSMAGPGPLAAIDTMLEALPEGAEAKALLAAEALFVSPHPDILVLARDLARSAAPLARAAGIELLSRKALLDPAQILASLDHPSAAVKAAALRALARDERDEALLPKLLACLRHEEPSVVWEAARTLTLLGYRDAYLELREGGALAAVLGARALEILVLSGELDDLGVMQALVRRLPASEGVLDAVARFGHAGSWAYLLHHLADTELADAAHRALETMFGPLVAGKQRKSPAAWRDALAGAALSPDTRYRRGAPWSLAVVAAERADGRRTRREIELRLDELRARGGPSGAIDLAGWGPEVMTPRPRSPVRTAAARSLSTLAPKSAATGAPSSAPSAPWASPFSAPSVRAEPSEPPSEAPSTAPIAPLRAFGEALPFAPPSAVATLPSLTLDQYASLCAELAMFPQDSGVIFQRHGLADDRSLEVDRAWKERLRQDPGEYAAWQARYQHHAARWAEQARRGKR